MKSGNIPKKLKQRQQRFPIGIIVGVFVAIALFLRIALPYNDIFVGDWVKFASNDGYYYMRLVDNMVANFPHLLTFDQYLVYPNGESVGAYYLFARLIATISWTIGLGAPTQHIVDLVGVYTPAVMGALVVVPVYFIGKELAGRWVGLISAGLIAILPGEFLGRSILGFTDHHVAEVLFSVVAMLFLIKAVKSAESSSDRTSGFEPENAGLNPASATKLRIRTIAYSALAGLFLGIYMLAWIGGLLFVFAIVLYLVAQFVVDHMRGKPTGYLCLIGTILFTVASIMFLPTVRHSFYFVAMAGVLLLVLALGGISKALASRKLKVAYYPMAITGVGAVGLFAFYLVNPFLFKAMMGMFSMFVAKGTQITTIEMQPLLSPNGTFSLAIVWGNFGLAFYLALISLAILLFVAVKRGDAVAGVIAVWSVVILAIALGQRRFAYYLAVNVAVLAGYLSWLALKWAGLKEWDANVSVKKAKPKRANYVKGMNVVLVGVVVFLVAFVPIIPSTVTTASRAIYVPSNAWVSSLDWLRENSPEPFGDDAYYELNASHNFGYGVLSWWDYGYWITRIAHRIPNANPSQIIARQTDVAIFLTSQDEQSADEVIGGMGSRYVIIDTDTATGKFWAIARYAGKSEYDYFGLYYTANENQLVPVQLFYPAYYRSMAIRLYNFDGKAAIPQNVIVMSYEQRTSNQGMPFNMVTDAKQFGSYGEADVFLSSQQSGNWRIVGNNPFVSPIPLEELKDYKLVYGSSEKKPINNVGEISEVKIFEYARQ